MKEDEDCIIYTPEETDLDNHPLVSKRTGILRHEMMLIDDPDTGMIVKLIRYPAGKPVPVHTHTCAKGMYVLKGTLRTEHGNFGPGSFIWWKAGSTMFHGATADGDTECLFITNKAFDIQYVGEDV